MPFRKIPDVDLEYGLISFDDAGKERPNDPAGGIFSGTLLKKAKDEKPTDIFLFSHGWKGDFAAAVDQYDRWIGAMWKLKSDRDAMGSTFRPLFIGLHWPSLPWGDENLPGAANFAEAALSPDFEKLFQDAAAHFGNSPEVRAPLRVIFDAQKADPGAVDMSDEVLGAYRSLAKAIGFSAGGGPSAPPDVEGAPLDPEEAVRADRLASAAVPFGVGGGFFKGVLGGLRQLSFWTMKKRARAVGEGGMHQFVAGLQNACSARLHLMGHSFGCIVMSSIANGPGGASILKPIDSLALVQGALSLWSYGDRVHNSSEPGYFSKVLTGKRITGPIVTTQSAHDLAVGVYYPAAVHLVGQAAFGTELPEFGAIGAFGIQGTRVAQARTLAGQTFGYQFKPGGVYNLESSEIIKKMDGASGAHSDIDGPEVAHMLWQAASVSLVEGGV